MPLKTVGTYGKYRKKDKENRKNHDLKLFDEKISEAAIKGMNNVIANRDRIIRRLTKLLSTNHKIDRLLGKKESLTVS